jgi:hypothetical protein
LDRQPAVLQILRKPPQQVERCELCSAGLDDTHGHLVNIVTRQILCACRPCYLLFAHEGAGGYRFRAVPAGYQLLPEFDAARDGWDALGIPVNLAFAFKNSVTGRVTAFYPSPAGAMESDVPIDSWSSLVAAVPALGQLLPDVQALVVANRTALVAPIDACYELVGRIRRGWRGMQGGDAVEHEVAAFLGRAASC